LPKFGWTDPTVPFVIHPESGEDLGEAQPIALHVLAFLRRAHVTILSGNVGGFINTIGALTLIFLAISGLTTRRFKSYRCDSRARGTFIYHSIAGVWLSLFAIMWGLTGACFAYPKLLAALPLSVHEAASEWLYALHAGTAGGAFLRTIWFFAAFGIVLVAITGMITFWRWRSPGHALLTLK
jgi:uncharacterized iron-regulated membrane protein